MSTTPVPLIESGQLYELSRSLEAHEGFIDVVAALEAGQVATLDGVWGSSCALVAAQLLRTAPATLVLVCPHQRDVDDLCDDLALFTPANVRRFPAWESERGDQILHDEIFGDRIRLLKSLASDDHPAAIVTSIQSLLQPVPSRRLVNENTRRIETGTELPTDDFLRWLVEHRFHNTSAVELPGEVSVRGGIIDVFAPGWDEPVRIELFGAQVESLRKFDIATQRSSQTLESFEITVIDPGRDDREHLDEYLPPDTWMVLVEMNQIQEEGQRYLERLEQPEKAHNIPSVLQRISRFPTVTASAVAPGSVGQTCRLQIQSVERFSGDITKVRNELDHYRDASEVFVVCQTKAEAKRMKDVFGTTRLSEEGKLRFPVGRLRQGFQLAGDMVLISGNELFQRTQVKRLPVRRLGKAIDNFMDLRPGDLVVHLAHGIGRYRGMQLLEKERMIEEHLEIEFHGGIKVYVPSSRIDLVQKYVGSLKSRPSLARIGGTTWTRQKKAAEKAVIDLASDMLQLQATRIGRPGIAFHEGSGWQQEFVASFPYHETPDQLRAMGDIQTDMSRQRPMDRLLCGDVGFGKTELAMRAAFLAVENGYQAAFLVPTTILAEQHHRTFRERMAEFPFEIAKLSRFCTGAEQQRILEGLSSGYIDIVIGTHRLASGDVQFQNLGLVVIDEEQRFGVAVKERLKSLRATVDILTMTATPIPRTLHMSLVGARDISNLQTPPEDRISVETRTSRFQPELIRHAVLRELNRGGQIYFVHNRVSDIETLAHKLREIVPEAAIRIGHGQMPESQLERVMVDFVAHRFDLLLATTIVESGLDIPNANTMFIDEADRYGLADLHQLRGRVGRYKHRAYCYLLIDPGKSLSPNAARRLRAIEEFSDLGAGFAIAMRDLEIRGAGNILGTQQSGHIAAVGYELYCQLLETAIRQMKRLPPKLKIDVSIDLPGEAYFPHEYITDMRLKIDLYRRLARVSTDDELDDLRAELVDRFGPPPEPVKRMLALVELKLDAAVCQIDSIHLEDQYILFGYTDRQRADQLVDQTGGQVRIVDTVSMACTLPKGTTEPDQIMAFTRSLLRR